MRLKVNLLKVAILTLVIIPFLGCTHYYYAPNAHNVPLLKEKNDKKINAAICSGDEFSGFEAQLAIAVKKNLGIMANFITANGKVTSNLGNARVDYSESGEGKLFEIGVGYFKPTNHKTVFETYMGGGLGTISNNYTHGHSEVKFNRLFIQSNLGISLKRFEIAFSARMAGLNYHSIDYNSLETPDFDDLEYIKNNKFSLLFEPAITIRTGWKHTKIQLQYVVSKNINNNKLQQELSNFNLGLHFFIPSIK